MRITKNILAMTFCAVVMGAGCNQTAYSAGTTFVAAGPRFTLNSNEGYGHGYEVMLGWPHHHTGHYFHFSTIQFDDTKMYRIGAALADATRTRKFGSNFFDSAGFDIHFSDDDKYGLGINITQGYLWQTFGQSGQGILLYGSIYGYFLGARDEKYDAGIETSVGAMLTLSF